MTRSQGSAGPSPFDADSAYLQSTLRHEPMELSLDDSVSLRTFGIILARALLAWVASAAVLGVIVMVVGFVIVSHSSEGALGVSGRALGAVGILVLIAFAVSVGVFWTVLLASKAAEPIGEWRTLLADRAWQSEFYYRMIRVVINRRQLPIASWLKGPWSMSVQLDTQSPSVIKHTIGLSAHEYHTYVTVFPYGTSLYVGWQMWRQRSGWQLIKRALADHMEGVDRVKVMLRTDRARAMREAVHLACREALYATPDEGLRGQSQELSLPPLQQESTLLGMQVPRPVISPSFAGPPSSSPAPPQGIPPGSPGPWR